MKTYKIELSEEDIGFIKQAIQHDIEGVKKEGSLLRTDGKLSIIQIGIIDKYTEILNRFIELCPEKEDIPF